MSKQYWGLLFFYVGGFVCWYLFFDVFFQKEKKKKIDKFFASKEKHTEKVADRSTDSLDGSVFNPFKSPVLAKLLSEFHQRGENVWSRNKELAITSPQMT